MNLKKFLVNIICSFIPSSIKRKQIRSKLTSTNIKEPEVLNNISGNEIILVKSGGETEIVQQVNGLNIHFNGKNSKVILHEPFIFNNCTFVLCNDNKIEIESGAVSTNNLYINTRYKSKVNIGKNFSCNGCSIECHDEAGGEIKIGDNCMFSCGINIRESDGHTIYDLNTKKILNRPQLNINIGNHVWVGMHVKLLKDISIADNTIIGAGALVTGKFDESNVIIAGIPAKVLKRGINWDAKNTDSFKSGYYDLLV